MNTTVLTTKKALAAHQQSILGLFEDSFGSRLTAELWTWAYIENPNGEPIVSLCHDGSRLVGHYAMIPMPLCRGLETAKSYLSMTTMIAPTHRGHGLFVGLAKAAYMAATSLGVDYVVGFPNQNSAPGFRKHLQWVLPPPDRIATFNKTELIQFAEHHPFIGHDCFSIPMGNDLFRKWRLAKPGTNYQHNDGLTIKTYGDAIDLVWAGSNQYLDSLPSGQDINVLIPGQLPLPTNIPSQEYQFGGTRLSTHFEPAIISRCMLMSDVF